MRFLLLALCASCGVQSAPKKIEWIAAPTGDVAPLVAAEAARAQAAGRRTLVYVGATWCEPCKRFHEAVQKGELDQAFGDLRFVEFDLDRDADRLRSAGYAPRLIPLFALPGTDGRATGRAFEGSIKGGGAVAEMTPKLQALLQARP